MRASLFGLDIVVTVSVTVQFELLAETSVIVNLLLILLQLLLVDQVHSCNVMRAQQPLESQMKHLKEAIRASKWSSELTTLIQKQEQRQEQQLWTSMTKLLQKSICLAIVSQRVFKKTTCSSFAVFCNWLQQAHCCHYEEQIREQISGALESRSLALCLNCARKTCITGSSLILSSSLRQTKRAIHNKLAADKTK